MKTTPCYTLLLGLALLATTLCGCVHRSVTVISDPPGAECAFNGRVMGETPATFPFKWYGTHRLSLRKEGYQTLKEEIELRKPVYQHVPLDLAAELWPMDVNNEHEFEFVLQPVETDEP